MNKLTKGSIAAGAGLVLLLGGAGTFMSWNDGDTTRGGKVTAGYLAVEADGAPSWKVTHEGGETEEMLDMAGFQIVPGDTVIYTARVNVTAEGENLEATLEMPNGAIAPAGGADANADQALADLLTVNAKYNLVSDKPENSMVSRDVEGKNSYTLNAGAERAIEPMIITATLEFPKGALGENDAMDGEVNLGDMKVNLTQNITPAQGDAE